MAQLYPLGRLNALILAPVPALAYLDCRSRVLPRPVTPIEAWRLAMARPLPGMRAAFWLRDLVSGWFGVRRIGGFTGVQPESVAVGDRLDFFTVEALSESALSLGARDRHLDVLTCISVEGSALAITSSVVTHNLFGRLYMLPVGLAHKVIVAVILRRVRQAVRALEPDGRAR